MSRSVSGILSVIISQRNPGPVLLPILGRKPDPQEPGIPIDVSRANLFDTTYVHKTLRHNDRLLWGYYNVYIKSLLWISSGTTAGMDQWIGAISPERHHPSKSEFLLAVSPIMCANMLSFCSLLQQIH